MFQGCFKEVFRGLPRVFQNFLAAKNSSRYDDVTNCVKEVSMVFRGSFMGVSGELNGYFVKVLRKIEGCFEEILREFQGSFMGVSRKLKGCFMKISRKRKFQGCFNGVS